MSAYGVTIPDPSIFGAPEKFNKWRPGQDALFMDLLESQSRFTIRNAPTGSGKSIVYMTAALASHGRVAVLTESKGLQDQLKADFESVMFDMRGLQNYACTALEQGGELEWMWQKRWGKPTCDIGPCSGGVMCELKNFGCHYFDSYRQACEARIVSTNYAYWMAIHRYGQGLGKFDWLILDEAHSAHEQLVAALTVKFNRKDFKELGTVPPKMTKAPMQVWRMWAREQLRKCTGQLSSYSGKTYSGKGGAMFTAPEQLPDAAEIKFWKRLEGKCQIVSDAQNDWVVEAGDKEDEICISPPWVHPYAEQYLFLNVKKIIMVSATVVPKISKLLGIADSVHTFKEYPSTFPPERRPIYWIPTVKMYYGMKPDDMRTWQVRIDQIIAKRQDRKGIIHTVSYERQKYLMEHSRFKHMFLANESGDTLQVVRTFKASKQPLILLSPSVGTGFDFPMDMARYQIIAKVPFPVLTGGIIKAQMKDDPEYPDYLTAQSIIQMYGRPNRAEDDFAETFIIDDNIQWFLDRHSGYRYDPDAENFIKRTNKVQTLFPEYFMEAFTVSRGVPAPPPLHRLNA